MRRLSGRVLAAGDQADVRGEHVQGVNSLRQVAHARVTDAMDYAMSLLNQLAPSGWRIAIGDAAGTATRVESGRVWGDPAIKRWAMFLVNSRATHDEIWRAAMTFVTQSTSPLVLRAIAEAARNAERAN